MSQPAKSSILAISSFVLGILSFFGTSILTGIPAIICGHISRSKIKSSDGELKGKGMALAGLIMGYLSIVIVIAVVALIALSGEDIQSLEMETERLEAMEQPVNP